MRQNRHFRSFVIFQQRVTGHRAIASIAHYDHAGVGVVEDKFREVLARL